MKRKSIFFISLACALCTSSFSGCGILSVALEYELSEDGTYYSVVHCDSMFPRKVIVPETYKNLPVTTIDALAFASCDTVTSITLPDSITTIGADAFSFCILLNTLHVGSGVESIADSAFGACVLLKNIEVAENNRHYTSIDGNLYTKNRDTLVQYATGKKDTSFVLPDSVTVIGTSAFAWCNDLESVTIGSRTTKIAPSAFDSCRKLKSVTFASPDEWYYTSDSSYTGGQQIDVGDPTKNAEELSGDNGKLYWYKK